MKKAGLFVKLGCVAIAATFWCSAVMAQSAAKYPGRKDTGPVSAKQAKIERAGQPQNNVVRAKVDPKLVKSRGNMNVARPGVAARICTHKPNSNPYAISRANFNKMPLSRQQFVLSHSDKYTIVD